MILRERLAQLLVCLEDLSSDDEANEEVSRTLDEAFYLCGKYTNRESFRYIKFKVYMNPIHSLIHYCSVCLLLLSRLHMVTWNVGTAEPPADVRSLLHLDSQQATDLYVIGLQEVNANPVRYISDLISEDSWSHLLMDTLAPMGYIKVLIVRLSIANSGNKGGVSVRFSFYGHMLCFLNCHLAAHMNYALQRMDEFEYILDMQDFDMYNTPQVLDHKVVFWFGDLNFRIADHGMHFLRSSINNGRFNLLWNRDQLTMMKKKEAILQEFEEGLLCFKPTYKFDRFSETYDTRAPKTWFGFM
ncbi:hypothetical protein cypCar_00016434 [Cyprinus carpio]|nr:hypothetical protein cypCar_00016434 [Cyprinus carpio]